MIGARTDDAGAARSRAHHAVAGKLPQPALWNHRHINTVHACTDNLTDPPPVFQQRRSSHSASSAEPSP